MIRPRHQGPQVISALAVLAGFVASFLVVLSILWPLATDFLVPLIRQWQW